MMIGPFPRSPDRIDGGVASAITYLCESLSADPSIELVGIRVVTGRGRERIPDGFAWPIRNLPLGRMSLSMLYVRQKRQFVRLVSELRPDVVHAQGADVAGYIAVDSGIPTVVTIHGLLAECAKFQTDPTSRLRASLAALVTERHTVRRASHLIAITPHVARYYGADITGRVHGIPNAVSPSFFAVERRPDRGTLLYAGRIAHGKGLPELLEAVARNRDYVRRVVLAGAAPDARYRDRVIADLNRLGLTDRVTLAGLLDEPALLGEFSRAEALVLPSHQETAPMVVQQAMAAGLPVIATRVGGIPDQIEHDRTGWLFDAGDAAQLSILIGQLATRPGSASSMASKARTVAEQRFRSAVVARATAAVYRSVLASGNGPGRR